MDFSHHIVHETRCLVSNVLTIHHKQRQGYLGFTTNFNDTDGTVRGVAESHCRLR
jgi:hypothetical protein